MAPAGASALRQKLDAIPIAFEPSAAGAGSATEFTARGANYSMALAATETTFAPVSGSAEELQMRFLGANAAANMAGEVETGAVSNYFVGKDPSKWRTNVPQYGAVRVKNLYDGVDLVYYGKSRTLEHDLIVAAGASPDSIRISFGRNNQVFVEPNGGLRISGKGSTLELRAPKIYQRDGERQLAVDGGYKISANNEIGFRLGAYDSTKELVIDPVFDFSTYFGGSGGDSPRTIALDTDGNIYLAGNTQSSDFPLKNPYQSTQNPTQCPLDPGSVPCGTGFISKFNPSATALIFSTYFGGTSTIEDLFSMAVDADHNVYLDGLTASSNFPTTPGALSTTFEGQQCSDIETTCTEAWVAKFAPTGSSLVYSTYLGGTNGESSPGQIAVDSNGDAVVVGSTTSADFPTTAGAFQTTCPTTAAQCYAGFVTKLNPTGTGLIYSTFLGGSLYDSVESVAIDSQGRVVVAGSAQSLDFPLVNPIQSTPTSAFFAKLKVDGSGLVFSSYFGVSKGVEVDFAPTVLDANDNIYLAGTANAGAIATTSGSFMPTAPAGLSLPFVTKIAAAGDQYSYSTYLGGSDASHPFAGDGGAVAVDAFGQAHVAGDTSQIDFPQVNPLSLSPSFVPGACADLAPQTQCEKGFVAVLNPQGSALVFSSYLGGTRTDFVGGVALDPSQAIYVVGGTNSTDFPTANAFQSAYSGGFCYNAPCFNLFLSKIQISPISATPLSLTFAVNVGGSSQPQTVMISNASASAVTLSSIAVTGNFSETNTCNGSVPAGSNCTVSVTFTPQSTATVTGNLTVTYGSSSSVVALTGTGLAPAATIAPTSISFGSVPIGSHSPGEVATMTNTGTGTLTISSVAISGDYSESDICGTTLAAGANCSYAIVFTPQAGGSRPGQLSVTTDASSTPLTVSLTGTGTGPLPTLAPTSLSFGQQSLGTTSPAQTVTLTNTGSSSLAITSIAASGDFAQTNTCGTSVAAGATCAASVTFAPTSAGTRAGSLTVTDNSFGSPRTVALSGTGFTLNVAPPSGSPSSVTVSAGQAATFNLQVQGQGITGSVALTANCGLVPMVSACSVSPSSVQLNGSAPAAFTLSVGTTKRSAIWPTIRTRGDNNGASKTFFNLAAALGMLLMLFAASKRQRNGMPWSNVTAITGLLLLTCFFASCGSGSSGGGSSGTPAGAYTVSVTASAGGASQTQNFTVVVQ